MLEINRQSNDRVHDIAACARGSSAHAELQRFPHQPTADTLGKIFTKFHWELLTAAARMRARFLIQR